MFSRIVFARIMIALTAVVVFAAATAALAVANAKVYSARATLVGNGSPAAIYGRNSLVGHDTSGAAIFRGELTPTCLFSLKQQSRC